VATLSAVLVVRLYRISSSSREARVPVLTVTVPAGAEPVVEPEPANVELTLAAKKWLFTPNTLSVSEGDTVSLTINPSGLDFTFAIPDLGVEKEVSGPTTVSFTANSAGSFDFACSSCESWRGMTGTLNVG